MVSGLGTQEHLKADTCLCTPSHTCCLLGAQEKLQGPGRVPRRAGPLLIRLGLQKLETLVAAASQSLSCHTGPSALKELSILSLTWPTGRGEWQAREAAHAHLQ